MLLIGYSYIAQIFTKPVAMDTYTQEIFFNTFKVHKLVKHFTDKTHSMQAIAICYLFIHAYM